MRLTTNETLVWLGGTVLLMATATNSINGSPTFHLSLAIIGAYLMGMFIVVLFIANGLVEQNQKIE